jgi:hypothetical protein
VGILHGCVSAINVALRYDAQMLRRLINLATIGSLLLCIATVPLWVRTYSRPQMDFFRISSGRSYGIGTERGGIIGFLQQERTFYHADDKADAQIRRWGFRYLRITSDGMRRWNLVLPFWLLACAAGALPVWRVVGGLRARRRQCMGRCAVCGYDLRATPGRCPECGRPARG